MSEKSLFGVQGMRAVELLPKNVALISHLRADAMFVFPLL
jgi:hypothetical protein